jgi:hypothetical protein
MRADVCFEQLGYVGVDGKTHNALADEFIPNKDFTTWTIKLRPDVLWHDGSKFGADDVIHTLNLAGSGKPGFDYAAALMVGIDLKAVKKIDDLTLSVPLSSPNAHLNDRLCDDLLRILKRGAPTSASAVTCQSARDLSSGTSTRPANARGSRRGTITGEAGPTSTFSSWSGCRSRRPG